MSVNSWSAFRLLLDTTQATALVTGTIIYLSIYRSIYLSIYLYISIYSQHISRNCCLMREWGRPGGQCVGPVRPGRGVIAPYVPTTHCGAGDAVWPPRGPRCVALCLRVLISVYTHHLCVALCLLCAHLRILCNPPPPPTTTTPEPRASPASFLAQSGMAVSTCGRDATRVSTFTPFFGDFLTSFHLLAGLNVAVWHLARTGEVLAYTHTHTHIHTYIHTYTHTSYIHAHTHTHAKLH